ncbi:MAG: cytosine deaminase [Nitrosopumilus sp. H13]|nr:MAG: cytosine deaminase [Nitrosopumilus sp. H13]
MLIRNAGILAGPELDYVPRADVQVRDGVFAQVAPHIKPDPGEEQRDCSGLLMIPGFINAHTHIGDSIAKDAAMSRPADDSIHPVYGAKQKILKNTHPGSLAEFMHATCRLMVSKGITTFVDFREGGADGVLLLREALKGVPIRAVILGRLEYYMQADSDAPLPERQEAELELLLKGCDGLGISGANENGRAVLERYSQTAKLISIHAAESEQSMAASVLKTGKSEVSRALAAKPHFLIHMTHASGADMQAASQTRGIVVCPRANASLAEGIPDIEAMWRAGCNVALGTDNVMINSPDMFREMDFAWKVTMGMNKRPVSPREILKMATVNGGRILGKKTGMIAPGMDADYVLLDRHALELEPVHSPHAAIVHRATESAIRAVIIGGETAHGKI